jgi:uncharacterized protein (TIGR02145 family)
MVITSYSPVSVSIIPSQNPVCSGIPVTFTATPSNGGSTPVYQWQVNGVNAGTNSNMYTFNPASDDLVSCILTSSLTCTSGNPASSNVITMTIKPVPIVTFKICNDTITTTAAKPFKLRGGIPIGGIYSGAGVTNGIFSPAIAGPGNHQITYTYTNTALCSANAHSNLHTFNPSNLACGSPLTDIRDNTVYPTIQINGQCWMAENLNYGAEITPTTLQTDNCLPERYYNPTALFGHPESVYEWDEMMQYDESVSNQGLCPPGWHVPSEADWNILFSNFTNNGFAANPLKYSGYSGFNAVLSGVRYMNKLLNFESFAIFFWSSTPYTETKAWAHGMNDPDPSVSSYPSLKANAFSVRCLKD